MDTYEIVLSNCSANSVQHQNGAIVSQTTPVEIIDSISHIESMNDRAFSLDFEFHCIFEPWTGTIG